MIPCLKQVVQHRIELLLGRIPGLGQVVVDFGRIDGLDRGLRIGVCGQQGALGVRINFLRLFQKIHARHARHPLIGEKQRNGVAPLLQLNAGVEGRLSRTSPQDTVSGTILPAQVLDHGLKNADVIVYGENDWLPHIPPVYYQFDDGAKRDPDSEPEENVILQILFSFQLR